MNLKKSLVLVIIALFNCTLFSQKLVFEKGYYVDNNNNKIEGFIKNLEWDYSPTQLEFKNDENAASKVIELGDFQEFSVGEEYKFKKAKVKLDKSSDKFEDATGTRNLVIVEDNLLLRVRVEGKATLYSYSNEKFTRFFYSTEDNNIQQLSFKVYYDKEYGTYRNNEMYKQEIFNNLKCEKIIDNDIERLEYKVSSLTDFFIKYNVCSGDLTNKFEAKKNHNTIEIYAKAGVGLTSFYYNYNGREANFSKKTNLKVGVETELNMSKVFKKWSVLFEIAYQQYSNSYSFNYVNDYIVDLDYKSLDVSVGFRRYFILNSKSNLFVDGYLTSAKNLNSSFNNTNLEIDSSINQILGIGYLYNKKYSMALRYEFGRNLLSKYAFADSDFSTVGLMLGYKFY